MRRILATMMMLLMTTAALAGCAGSDVTQDDVDKAREEGRLAGLAEATPVSTLDTVIAAGNMNCGVKSEQWGMGYQATENSSYQGLDVDYCKAIAAAIGVDVTFIYASGGERFNLLSDGAIDVLIRTSTWTSERDAELNADFAGINFYDGQTILVRGDRLAKDTAGNTVYGLTGLKICVATGTTTEGNLAAFIDEWSANGGQGAAPEALIAADANGARAAFTGGECDAYTGDGSAMAAYKWQLENNGATYDDPNATNVTSDDTAAFDLWIAPELLSKEPLAAAVRDMDTEWKEVVEWVWYGMVTAEEMGITSTNYMNQNESLSAVSKLFGDFKGLGTDTNPMQPGFMKLVLEEVGNYGEAYDRNFCDGTYDGISGSAAMTGCVLPRLGTQNMLVSEGGLQFAPVIK